MRRAAAAALLTGEWTYLIILSHFSTNRTQRRTKTTTGYDTYGQRRTITHPWPTGRETFSRTRKESLFGRNYYGKVENSDRRRRRRRRKTTENHFEYEHDCCLRVIRRHTNTIFFPVAAGRVEGKANNNNNNNIINSRTHAHSHTRKHTHTRNKTRAHGDRARRNLMNDSERLYTVDVVRDRHSRL